MVLVDLVVEPDEEVEGCAVLSVDGTVAGVPHRFILDSGSPSTQIADADAWLPATVVGEDTGGGLFGSAAVERVTVADLTVPGLTAGSRTVSRLRNGGPAARSVLGLDVLGQHALLLDGPAATLHATAAGGLAADRPLERAERGHRYLPVMLPGGRVVRGLWDTGAGITVVGRELVTSHPELFTPAGSAGSTDSMGATAATDIYRFDAAYAIADVPFAGHPVAVADLPDGMEFVIGYPTLCQAVWSIDLPSNRWSVERPDA